jgi:hypothetical protein
MKEKKKIWLTAGIALFVAYFFLAARPVPRETALVPRWLSSLESETPVAIDEGNIKPSGALRALLPFTLSGHFGYIDSDGRFAVNRIKKGEASLSENWWAEYEAAPSRIEIRGSDNETMLTIEEPQGYPFFLDGRIFIIGNEQNSLSEIDNTGATLWTYEFAAPLTCVDAAAGLVLAGSLDGVAEVLDREGNRLFFFEPGGSRYSIILGCAISSDGSRLGIISGIDDQRFLLLERFGGGSGGYKVVYHEFLEDGFRRPVYIAFIEQDRWLFFEREEGIGVYDISARQGRKLRLEGEIVAVDQSGGQGLFFIVTAHPSGRKELVAVRLPGRIIMEAPFKSDDVFLGRAGSRLFVGGGQTLASFELERR